MELAEEVEHDDEEGSFVYMSVSLEFEHSPPEMDEILFRYVINMALKQLHGDIGAAIMVDLKKFEPKKLAAILKVLNSDLVKLWSALTLYGYFDSMRCAFIVHQVSPNMSVAEDSRQDSQKLSSECG